MAIAAVTETAVSEQFRTPDAGGEYTLLSATYQSSQTIDGGSNSSNSNALAGGNGMTGGMITIAPGNHTHARACVGHSLSIRDASQ
jgi:hypothetical protein